MASPSPVRPTVHTSVEDLLTGLTPEPEIPDFSLPEPQVVTSSPPYYISTPPGSYVQPPWEDPEPESEETDSDKTLSEESEDQAEIQSTMSKPKSKEGGSSGSFHQDYVASLRYRNDLPPPEMPPNLLDIPHEGLERFLTPGFASNLARREEPNIDVDAEGGMPIDPVGIPGLHLGDESAIMTPEQPQPIDPADLPLLMTLEQLKNPVRKNDGVSFLRRTQYISSESVTAAATSQRPVPTRPKSNAEKSKKAAQNDPENVKRHIQKGFDTAYPESKHKGEETASKIRGHTLTKAELDAWNNPVHPDNPKLKPVGFFPLVPDLKGFSDCAGPVQFKFEKAPVQAVKGKADKRMKLAILHPSAPEERVCQEHATKVALHKSNPDLYPDPGAIPWDYDLFLPEVEATEKVMANLRISNPDRDNKELYAHESPDGNKYHRYERVRTYATGAQTLGNDSKQKDIALTLHDPAEVKDDQRGLPPKQKAAYYYPIIGKTRLKPERSRTIAKAGLAPTRAKTKEDQVDQIQVVVRDPDEAEVYKRSLHRAAIDPKFAKTLPPPPKAPSDEPESPKEEDHEQEDEASGDADNQTAPDDDEDRMSDE